MHLGRSPYHHSAYLFSAQAGENQRVLYKAVLGTCLQILTKGAEVYRGYLADTEGYLFLRDMDGCDDSTHPEPPHYPSNITNW